MTQVPITAELESTVGEGGDERNEEQPTNDQVKMEESPKAEQRRDENDEQKDAIASNEPEKPEEEDSVSMEATARKALFAAVEGGAGGEEEILSCRPIVRLFFYPSNGAVIDGDKVSAKEQRESLLQAVRSHKFHKGYARRLFSSLGSILAHVVENEEYVPVSAFEDEDVDEDGYGQGGANRETLVEQQRIYANEITPDEKSTEALLFLRACALVVDAYLNGLIDRRKGTNSSATEVHVIEEAFAVAELLHGALFSLQSCGVEGQKAQTAIALLCEKWYGAHFVDRELLVTQMVPLLVVKALDGPAQKTNIKRLFVMRESLDLLDFKEDSIAFLRSLLLRTVSSPLFLRNIEGRKFISHLFGLDVSLVSDLHKAIRAQIPDAKKSILEAYGEIYFRSWKDNAESSPDIRSSIEDDCLQDLMYALLHVASPSMVKSIGTVLKPFHDAKKSPNVEKLIHKLYSPILWRALSAANPLVRVNAAAVLSDTFPLKDPDEGQIHIEAIVQKTVSALTSHLGDIDPQVRAAGSAATSVILGTFWDAIPSDDIRTLLNHIITKHASDASSAAVRAESLSAITLILENPHSHAVLRPLLPSLGNLIHDNSEKVRLASVRMLLQIKQIRGIKYYHVVPVDHLLARLEEEGEGMKNPNSAVASSLTKLMINSYYPQGDNITGADQIRRTLSFLKNNSEAAAVFYRNVSSHLSANSVAKLAAMLLKCLYSSTETEKNSGKGKKRERSSAESSMRERSCSESRDGALSASKTTLMASIAETICCLWESIGPTLKHPRNVACNEFLREAFSGSLLTDIVSHFTCKANDCDEERRLECHRVCAAILRCAGRLPPKAVTGLASHIAAQFASSQKEDAKERKVNLCPHVALLCTWGMQEDVANSLASSIKTRFSDGNESADDIVTRSSQRRRSSKRKKGSIGTKGSLAIPELPPDIALQVLGSILGGADPSCVSAREAILASESACSAIEGALEQATTYAENILNRHLVNEMNIKESTVGLVLAACESYGRLALHKEARNGGDIRFNQQAKTLLFWISERVVPALITKKPAGGDFSPLGELNLSRISVEDSREECNLSASFSSAPAAPPRRRSNRNKTPNSFDASFESIGDSASVPFVYEGSNTLFVEVSAVSLIKSALLVFAEWVAVGGTGSNDIGEHVVKWAQILHFESEKINVKREVLPCFVRLGTNLANVNGGNISLLKEVIVACPDLDEESNVAVCLKKSLVSLLTNRRVKKQVSNVIDGILDAVEVALAEGSNFEDEADEGIPLSVSDCLPEDNGGAIVALSAILGSVPGSIEIGRKIASRIERGGDGDLKAIHTFYVKFLWILFDKAPKAVPSAEVKQAIRSINISGVMGSVRLMESLAEKVQ